MCARAHRLVDGKRGPERQLHLRGKACAGWVPRGPWLSDPPSSCKEKELIVGPAILNVSGLPPCPGRVWPGHPGRVCHLWNLLIGAVWIATARSLLRAGGRAPGPATPFVASLDVEP